MQETRPCTCGGSNDNCCYCFGSGMRPVLDGSQVPTRSFVSRIAQRIRKSKSNIRKCNICGFEGGKVTMRSHKAEAHPSTALPPSLKAQDIVAIRPSLAGQLRKVAMPPLAKPGAAPRPQNAPQKFVASSAIVPSAPRSETIIRRESIAAGLIKPATKPLFGRPAPPFAPAHPSRKLGVQPALPAGYCICPLCRCQLQKTRLSKHLNKAHSRVPKVSRTLRNAKPVYIVISKEEKERAQLAKAQAKLARSNPSSLRYPSKNSASQPEEKSICATVKFVSDLPSWQRQDEMDANRGMGHFARDNGRFGSHALHDRFDDESAP